MSLFNVDINELKRLLVPPKLRKDKMLDWLKSLIAPIRWLFDRFTEHRNGRLYDLKHTGQVVYLEAALNDRFDPNQRGIYITDYEANDTEYVYTVAEQKPLFVYLNQEAQPVYLYTLSETSAMSPDFIVNVPVVVVFDANEMTALVNYYKLASKIFIIKIV